jgi:kumamolisin
MVSRHHLVGALISAAALLLAALTRPAPATGLFHETVAAHQSGAAYTPSQIETAYDYKPLQVAGLTGAGQTVALIEISKFNSLDIHQFDTTYNLPDPTIQEYYAGGSSFPLESGAETSLDIEWLHALAPGAAIQVYYLDNRQDDLSSWRSLASVLRMASSNGAGIVSISLGACGPSTGYKVARSAFSDLAKVGVTAFVSSGDFGDRPGPVRDCGKKIGVSYPSGDPSVVAVGGTSLQLNGDSTIAHEVAWRLSGGGRVTSLVRPLWQKAPKMPKDRYRWVPDVAYVGDPGTGVSFVQHGQWMQAGGTSLGAPAWAAAWALARQSALSTGVTLGAAAPLLYRIGNSTQYSTIFHDITAGTNGRYHAGVGWDPVTGWGTPDVAKLAAAVQNPSSLTPPAKR